MPEVSLRLLNTGTCFVPERHILVGGAGAEVRLPALVALLQHPEFGWLLFDTGYAPRLQEASADWPYALYRRAAPFSAPPELAVAAQLPQFGLTPDDISLVVVSHFHPDHIAGLHDFPRARFVATRSGYESVRGRRGFSALRRAFLPDLLPEDFAERATLLEDADFDRPEPGLSESHDLFGDGALRLIRLPGHAVGQVGLLARTDRGPVFLVADAAYLRQSVRENRPPPPVTALFSESRAATARTLSALHAFSRAQPGVTIVPAHCPEAFAEFTALARDDFPAAN